MSDDNLIPPCDDACGPEVHIEGCPSLDAGVEPVASAPSPEPAPVRAGLVPRSEAATAAAER